MAAPKITPAPLTRPLSEIAREIRRDFADKGKPVYFAAEPYVHAMRYMETTDLSAKFYYDGAEEVVIKLLGNLSTWRGETATRIRNELKAALAWHKQEKRELQDTIRGARYPRRGR